MNFLSANSLYMMERSMDYLWTKQAAILDNIANAETPNYKAKYVTFEESLREKMEAAARGSAPKAAMRNVLQNAQVEVNEAQEATRLDGNGVNLTEQNLELSRNGYQLQYVLTAINNDFSVLRSAIKGQ